MSLRTFIQDHPTPLVWMWRAMEAVLPHMKGLFQRVGVERSSRILRLPEEAFKRPVFDCQSCGQCVLHYSGMTCPMTCPKNLRNGPCGGARLNGKCEVKPEKDCVWVKAYQRSQKTSYRHEIYRLNPPVDWRLHDMTSWVTFAAGLDQVPTGTDVKVRYADEALQGGDK